MTFETVLVLCLGGLCACEGSPGEARVQVYDAASAAPGWQQTVPAESAILASDAPDGVLRVATSDYCWDSNLLIDYERETGALLSQQRRGPSAGTGGPLGPLEPPTACASGYATQRLTLSSAELVDVCSYTGDNVLAVSSVSDGSERLRLSIDGYRPVHIAGDQLVLGASDPAHIDTYSLLSGQQLWSWTAPESYTQVVGADAERLYLHSEGSRESHALTLSDGTVVWQRNLGCDSLSLAGGLLVCMQSLRASTCDYD